MLAVKEEHRGQGIATRLVRMALDIMIERDAEEVKLPLSKRTPTILIRSDCPGNRSHKRLRHDPLRKTGLSQEQTPSPILP